MAKEIIICGDMKVPCGYRNGKECLRPRQFSCQQVLDKFDEKGKVSRIVSEVSDESP